MNTYMWAALVVSIVIVASAVIAAWIGRDR